MKKTLPQILLIVILTSYACAPLVASPPIPSNTHELTSAPTDTALPTSESLSGSKVKIVNITDTYVIEIPEDFTVHENLSSPTTVVPIYRIETSNNTSFDIAVHPYTVSSSPIPGKCVVSTGFDADTTSAPIFCEGLELIDLFNIPSGWIVKYGIAISDLSLACTMNSPCPVEVPLETRYSVTYVFVISDKSHGTILEFFVGDAFRNSSNKIDSFEGLGTVLYNSIIPSLSIRTP